MAKRTIVALSPSAFPSHPFYEHLRKGTAFFQEQNFERALEEWSAAERTSPPDPVALPKQDGKVACGVKIEEVPFLFFLSAVHMSHIDGVGVIKSGELAKKVVFNDGKIVRAGTSKAEERIGKFILTKRQFSEQHLENLAQEAKDDGKRLGQYLVDKGYLTAQELREVLALQAEEILSDVLSWKEGMFYILEDSVQKETGASYTPIQFAMVVARRWFNSAHFRNRIPSNKIIFRASPYTDSGRDEILKRLNVNAQFIFSLIDGTRNIDQLIQFSGLEEVTVINILYTLSFQGLIRRSKEVVEYEDKEYNEIAKIMGVLFDIYRLLTTEILRELGRRGEQVIREASAKLSPNAKRVFHDIDLENTGSLSSKLLLRNIATYFPTPEQRPIFIDAFRELFNHLLNDLVKFLGAGLTRKASDEVGKIIADIERFASDSVMKIKLIEVLTTISGRK